MVVRTETIRVTPPATLLADCREPAWEGATLGQLPDYIQDLQAALVACNIDKQKLREWATDPASEPLR